MWLIGGSMPLWGWAFETLLPASFLEASLLFDITTRCRTLSCFSSTVSAWMMHASRMIKDWTAEPVAQPQLNVVSYKSCLCHGIFSQQWKPKVMYYLSGGFKVRSLKSVDKITNPLYLWILCKHSQLTMS